MKPPPILAGPRRLVLIQSGKYDYADIDLSRPFQLVGVNGLGKTALISTLQYLYLDTQRDMRFGKHGTDESRRFYFKGDASFILFECETSIGTTTIGARGLGAVGGYELQRFSWSGVYDRSDFLDEGNRPRSWDDVRARLAPKELRILEDVSELRRLLGAVDEDTNESWAIVPLVDAKDYPRFRQTFQRLLQLRDLKQDDLKQLLADCAKLSPSEREVDLAKDFQRDLERINRDRMEVAALRAAAAKVREARGLLDQEFAARAIAHAAACLMRERYANHAADFKRNHEALYEEIKRADGDLARLEGERTEHQAAYLKAAGDSGVVKNELETLDGERQRFANFVPELEEQARAGLDQEVQLLRERLRDIPMEEAATLERQLVEVQTQLLEKKTARDRTDALVINWLRRQLGEDAAARVAALFDPRLLQGTMDQQVAVRDEEQFTARLRAIAENATSREYNDELVSIEFAAGAVNKAKQLGRPEQLAEEIRRLERDATRLARDVETVRNAATMRARLPEALKELGDKSDSIRAYQRFGELELKEPELREKRTQLEAALASAQRALDENEKARHATEERRQTAIRKFDQLTREDAEIRREALNLPSADGEDPGPTPPSDMHLKQMPESLLETIRETRDRCSVARTKASLLAAAMTGLDKEFSTPTFQYDHAAPAATRLSQLEAEIASVDERATDIDNRWTALLTDARSGFSAMLKSLRAVTKQAQKLTAELGKIEFSSIAEVRLEIVQNQTAVAEYERYAKDAAQPSLFDTPEEAELRMSRFAQLLQRRPRLLLWELFSLRCEVKRKDGTRNFYDDFDQVESTGTTVVLKVSLNLLVLRDLLVPGKARIPYYLDEVHALDRQNFGNILELSERLGFVGIYAAPTAAIGPRRFVHLVPDARGRLVVTAAHCKDIVRAPEDADANVHG